MEGMQTDGSDQDEATSQRPLLRTKDLTKRYGSVVALDALNLELQPGVTGLVGANGAGKSTLIKLLLGLLEPTSGSAEVLGYDVQRQGPELRQYIGYMPEHDCLPNDVSATEFVSHMAQVSGLPAGAARERTAETLRHVGLFEERYREMRGYSTGMKQRVKLAQALVHDPLLMLLDEPTNGLDPRGRNDMLDLIERIGSEFRVPIILSSHLLGEIERVCEHLVEIAGGRLVRSVPMSTLTQATGLLIVEVDGEVGLLESHLSKQGMSISRDGRALLVSADGDGVHDKIRDAVVDLNLGLVRLEPARGRLEDIFAASGSNREAAGA
jgi:ABC-2 type transport system ATP-binding protein